MELVRQVGDGWQLRVVLAGRALSLDEAVDYALAAID